MKKADKPNVIINIFSGNTLFLDGKSMVHILLAIVLLALIVSICSPDLRTELIYVLIRIAESY